MRTSWVDFATKTFMGQYFQEEPLSKEIQKKTDAIARFYFKDGFEFDNQEGFKNLTDAFGDSGFLYGTHLMAGYGYFILQGVSKRMDPLNQFASIYPFSMRIYELFSY